MALGTQPLTIAMIESYLDRLGWQQHGAAKTEDGAAAVLVPWTGSAGTSYMLLVELRSAQDAVVFKIPKLVDAPRDGVTAGQLADLLSAVAFSNYASILGTFCYDVSDGEVRLQYGFPLDNGALSYEQFARIVGALVTMTDYWAPRVRDVVSGQRAGDSVVASFVQHLQGFSP
jgi:hypothetical protein